MLRTYGMILLYGIFAAFVSLTLLTLGSFVCFGLFLLAMAVISSLPYILTFMATAAIGCVCTNLLRQRYMRRRLQKAQDKYESLRMARVQELEDRSEVACMRCQFASNLKKAFMVSDDMKVREGLREIQMYMNNLPDASIRENMKIVEGMAYSFKLYTELSSQIRTERTNEAILKIQDAFPTYRVALKNMYDRAIAKDLMAAEVHIDSLNSKINLEGFSNNEFANQDVTNKVA